MYIRDNDWAEMIGKLEAHCEFHQQNSTGHEAVASQMLNWVKAAAEPPKDLADIECLGCRDIMRGGMSFGYRDSIIDVYPTDTGGTVVVVDGEQFDWRHYSRVMQDCVDLYLKDQKREADERIEKRQAILARLS